MFWNYLSCSRDIPYWTKFVHLHLPYNEHGKRNVQSYDGKYKCDAQLLSALRALIITVRSFLWRCFSLDAYGLSVAENAVMVSLSLHMSHDSRLCFLSLIVNIHLDKSHCFSFSLCFCSRLYWCDSLTPSIQWSLTVAKYIAANIRLQVCSIVWVMDPPLWL